MASSALCPVPHLTYLPTGVASGAGSPTVAAPVHFGAPATADDGQGQLRPRDESVRLVRPGVRQARVSTHLQRQR